ncbi:MAG TPA: hypothetical protein VHV10_08370 [Ktedonobacteraceae bacterium]|jgi:hypothetical protein|nr:hypothetical protein [Ktedonobacteraceae bacterium]
MEILLSMAFWNKLIHQPIINRGQYLSRNRAAVIPVQIPYFTTINPRIKITRLQISLKLIHKVTIST